MENEEIISLNVREILEDVEQQLVKIGIYSKPVFETEDFGFTISQLIKKSLFQVLPI